VEEILGGSGDWAQFAGNVENVGVGGAASAGGDALCATPMLEALGNGLSFGVSKFQLWYFLVTGRSTTSINYSKGYESRLDRGHLNPSERHRNAVYVKDPTM